MFISMAALVVGLLVIPTVVTAGTMGYFYGLNAGLLVVGLMLFFNFVYPTILGSVAHRFSLPSQECASCASKRVPRRESGRNGIYEGTGPYSS